MLIHVDEFYKEFYEQGHLNYVITELQKFYSVDDWVEWLKHEPIGFFENSEDWTREENTVVYMADSDEREVYDISMILTLPNDDVLFHCANASQSMFFQVLEAGDRLRLIYVD